MVPPLTQLGFSAYESIEVSLFARKEEKYTAITYIRENGNRGGNERGSQVKSEQRSCLDIGH